MFRALSQATTTVTDLQDFCRGSLYALLKPLGEQQVFKPCYSVLEGEVTGSVPCGGAERRVLLAMTALRDTRGRRWLKERYARGRHGSVNGLCGRFEYCSELSSRLFMRQMPLIGEIHSFRIGTSRYLTITNVHKNT